MGGTDWRYIVQHQVDVNAALQELRQRVFRRGEYPYRLSDEEEEALIAHATPLVKKLYEFRDQLESQSLIKKPTRIELPSPLRTIEDLVEQREESGTHSIIDINHISDTLELGALTALTEEQLTKLLQTTQPTRAMVEEWERRIPARAETQLHHRWQGVYFTLYKDGLPDELYFMGESGD